MNSRNTKENRIKKRNNYIFLVVAGIAVIVGAMFNYVASDLESIAEKVLQESRSKSNSELKVLLSNEYVLPTDLLSKLEPSTLIWGERQLYSNEDSDVVRRALLVGNIQDMKGGHNEIKFYYVLNDKNEWKVKDIKIHRI
ncbi:MAG: hypothetical protein KUG78_21850 [Kangiellaceae bacterium]|nr:hypothetical protein [Kangiellaceae bacterium]